MLIFNKMILVKFLYTNNTDNIYIIIQL